MRDADFVEDLTLSHEARLGVQSHGRDLSVQAEVTHATFARGLHQGIQNAPAQSDATAAAQHGHATDAGVVRAVAWVLA